MLVGEGYAASFKELLEATEWEKYGTAVNPKCADCMVHSGFEATAVDDTFRNPLKAFKVFLQGPKTEGPMAPEIEFEYGEQVDTKPKLVAETKAKASDEEAQRVA